MSVVYGIIKRHQGKIRVQSKVDRGSTFVVTLPEKADVEQEVDQAGLEDILSTAGTEEVSQ